MADETVNAAFDSAFGEEAAAEAPEAEVEETETEDLTEEPDDSEEEESEDSSAPAAAQVAAAPEDETPPAEVPQDDFRQRYEALAPLAPIQQELDRWGPELQDALNATHQQFVAQKMGTAALPATAPSIPEVDLPDPEDLTPGEAWAIRRIQLQDAEIVALKAHLGADVAVKREQSMAQLIEAKTAQYQADLGTAPPVAFKEHMRTQLAPYVQRGDDISGLADMLYKAYTHDTWMALRKAEASEKKSKATRASIPPPGKGRAAVQREAPISANIEAKRKIEAAYEATFGS